MDGFTAHCSQLCRRSWEQFVQVIDHLSGCTQPENLQIASLIGVGRILLHEVQASTTHCLTDKLLLILVTKYALSKQGSAHSILVLFSLLPGGSRGRSTTRSGVPTCAILVEESHVCCCLRVQVLESLKYFPPFWKSLYQQPIHLI